MEFKTIKSAELYVGKLSVPAKMPCYSYSIPAKECITGSLLREVEGSVCEGCYAFERGFYNPKFNKYIYPALYRRLDSLKKPYWVDAMVFLIDKKEKSGYFRWHDSGDLQGKWHLDLIIEVAKRTPNVKHWLPTREYAMLKGYSKLPKNLIVRLSAHMVDGKPPKGDLPTSTVHSHGTEYNGKECGAYKQGNKCQDCRLCWELPKVNISYLKH